MPNTTRTPTEQWLTQVCNHIHGTRRRARIRRELEGHLQDHMRQLHAQGMTLEQAEAQTVLHMGDPDAVGHAIAQTGHPLYRLLYRTEQVFFWALLAFLVVLSVMILVRRV